MTLLTCICPPVFSTTMFKGKKQKDPGHTDRKTSFNLKKTAHFREESISLARNPHAERRMHFWKSPVKQLSPLIAVSYIHAELNKQKRIKQPCHVSSCMLCRSPHASFFLCEVGS